MNYPASSPWGHNVLIFGESESVEQAVLLQQTIDNAWSRDILALQIKSQLHNKKAKLSRV